jgi:hypothetical protein
MKRFLARLLSGLLVLSVLLTPVGVHAQEASRAITKLDPPVAVQVTASKVTLQYTEGHQYSKDGTHWQNIAVFTGLKADQSYSFYQRIAGEQKPACHHQNRVKAPLFPSAPGTAAGDVRVRHDPAGRAAGL